MPTKMQNFTTKQKAKCKIRGAPVTAPPRGIQSGAPLACKRSVAVWDERSKFLRILNPPNPPEHLRIPPGPPQGIARSFFLGLFLEAKKELGTGCTKHHSWNPLSSTKSDLNLPNIPSKVDLGANLADSGPQLGPQTDSKIHGFGNIILTYPKVRKSQPLPHQIAIFSFPGDPKIRENPFPK